MGFYNVIDISSFVALLSGTAFSQQGIIEHRDPLVTSLGYGGTAWYFLSSSSSPGLGSHGQTEVLGEGRGAQVQLGARDGGEMERVWECCRMRG